MSNIISIIIALIIFSVLVLIHEFGHFIVAKKNGIVVNEFSIGMGPRICSFEKGGTKYSIKCLPFGGSCAMLGEDEDTVVEGSFNSKSVWARMAVVFAGPFFNFILAFVLSFIVIVAIGTDKSYVTAVDKSSPAYEAGLRKGDIITKYNGAGVSIGREMYLEDFVNPLGSDSVKLTFIRNGKKHKISYKPEEVKKYMVGMSYNAGDTEATIGNVTAGSAMDEAGAQPGDVVVAVDGTEIKSGDELQKYIEENPFGDNTVTITVNRNGKTKELEMTPQYQTVYSKGFDYNLARKRMPFGRTLKYSFVEVKYQINTVLKSLKMLVTGKVSANEVSGPVGIVSAIGDTYEASKSEGAYMALLSLINMAIMLSANLGVMNLLPLPALDGGRIVFCIIEVIKGKPVSRDKEGMVHFIGFALLMVLMVFLIFNDVRKLL